MFLSTEPKRLSLIAKADAKELKRLAKLWKVERKARREQMRLQYIDDSDVLFWSPQDWMYLKENTVLVTGDGFYVRAMLFEGIQ